MTKFSSHWGKEREGRWRGDGWGMEEEPGPLVHGASSSRNLLRTYDAEGGYNLCFWFCLPCSEALHHLQLVSLPKAAWNSLASRGTISEALILYIHLLHRLRKREREKKNSGSSPSRNILSQTRDRVQKHLSVASMLGVSRKHTFP